MRTVLTALWSNRRAVLVYAILIFIGWRFGAALRDIAVPELRPMNEPMIHGMVMTALVAYVLLAAIPFVPGAEIGFALLLLFGAKAAPVVYAGMVGALILAFLAARLVPVRILTSAFAWLGLNKAALLMRAIEGKPPAERGAILTERLQGGAGGWVARNRYLAFALAINTPGNSLLGGGGGLAFAAGLSGLFAFPAFVVAVLVAVAPVPLLFWLTG